jgi:hypothetical protein
MPSLLVLFISSTYVPSACAVPRTRVPTAGQTVAPDRTLRLLHAILRMYWAKPCVLLRHCSAEFIKHVLPKLLRPHTP